MPVTVDIKVSIPIEVFEEGRAQGAIDRAVRAAVLEGTAFLQRKVKLEAPKDTGALAGSVRMILVGQGRALQGRLTSSLLYSNFVDKGITGGALPPGEPLERWVRRKRLKPKGRLAKRLARKKLSKSKVIKAIAFAIRHKIRRKGIKPTGFIRETVKRNLPATARIMARAFKRQVERS